MINKKVILWYICGTVLLIGVLIYGVFHVLRDGFGQGISSKNRSYWVRSDVQRIFILMEEMDRLAMSGEVDGRIQSPFSCDRFEYGEFSYVYNEWRIYPFIFEHFKSIPTDRYSRKRSEYRIACMKNMVVIISAGRNGMVDTKRDSLEAVFGRNSHGPEGIDQFQYNPTNGANSKGDILFVIREGKSPFSYENDGPGSAHP